MAAEASIRPMRPGDLPAVAALERLCNPLPWKEEDLRPFAEAEGQGRHLGWVAHGDADLAGYVCATQGFGEAEILVFGVHPARRRQGFGRALLRGLMAALSERGCDTLFLEVRRGNAAALALYRAEGFQEIGLRKGYYADSGEEAALMRRG